MSKKVLFNKFILLITTITLLIAGGCSSSRKVKFEAGYGPIDENRLRQVVVGETTKDGVISSLGEPSRIEKTATGGDLIKYETRKSEEVNAKYGLFLFRVHYKEEHVNTLNIELNNGVVKKIWRN